MFAVLAGELLAQTNLDLAVSQAAADDEPITNGPVPVRVGLFHPGITGADHTDQAIGIDRVNRACHRVIEGGICSCHSVGRIDPVIRPSFTTGGTAMVPGNGRVGNLTGINAVKINRARSNAPAEGFKLLLTQPQQRAITETRPSIARFRRSNALVGWSLRVTVTIFESPIPGAKTTK